MPSDIALELRGIGKLYGRTAALRAIDLRLNAGETLALLGANGSGKTTLLKIVAGAISPTVGSGTVFGCDMTRERTALRLVGGLLSAESYLYDDLSAAENLRFVVTMAGRKPQTADIAEVLGQVNLAAQAQDRVRTFSSGMRRRLSLARLVILRPRLLLLDEPYNSLDAAGADTVDMIIKRQARDGGATVLATHDAARALTLAEQVAVLRDGALQFVGGRNDWRAEHAQLVG